ncbi:MAG: DUF5678 domain-containing protein [Candidatus Marsarchaeota archaeon]|jgi:uncharacterized protein (UPF0262 family)|nr:DUF5678 domain-containing protein [Candidatus Marsarchaeota archaeon]MCL5111273.1 DUF5678 domain-containing protein [Candidatus Marsarchaeota archaeon]
MAGELELIKQMDKNARLVREKLDALKRSYPDQYVAIDNGRVIAHNSTLKALNDVLDKKKVELTTVLVQFVPRKGVEILF